MQSGSNVKTTPAVLVILRADAWMLLKCGMGNGEWGMENGEWEIENGKWEIENGKLIFFTLTFYNVE